jgi:uncharacterized protein YvpB
LNTTPNKWLDPPMLIALAASYVAGFIIAIYLTATLLTPYLGDLHLPRLPFPGGSSAPGGAPVPSLVVSPTLVSTRQPDSTIEPSASPLPTLSSTPSEPTSTPTPTLTPTKTRKPTVTPTKTRAPLPSSAMINGVVSHPMISGLDCEARAAVDWAAFFGTTIDEKDFLNKMPKSDNPEKGFVGNWWDVAGGIPPYSYGIHAKPLAAELRNEYKVVARARKDMPLDDILYEVAAGRPVIVYVVGPVQAAKIGVEYTAPDGEKMMVAAYEHTVILIGYDENTLTFVDGGYTYTRPKADFLVSWAQLSNMAVFRGEK